MVVGQFYRMAICPIVSILRNVKRSSECKDLSQNIISNLVFENVWYGFTENLEFMAFSKNVQFEKMHIFFENHSGAFQMLWVENQAFFLCFLIFRFNFIFKQTFRIRNTFLYFFKIQEPCGVHDRSQYVNSQFLWRKNLYDSA